MTTSTEQQMRPDALEGYRDSSFVFEHAVGRGGSMRYCSHATGGSWRRVDLTVDDSTFLFRALASMPPLVADLVDLAAAILAADRLSPQKLDAKMRRIQLTVPVRERERLSSCSAELSALLSWASATNWEFEFVPRRAPMRTAEAVMLLPDLTPPDAEVVLWSGGLDALAGVYGRLRAESAPPVVLLGSGSNDRVFGRQKTLASELGARFRGKVSLHQVPIRLRGIQGLPQDRLMRSRGVIFTLVGCMTAHLLGQRRLVLHENGVGALNLPYHESSIGLDHVRSVHPFTLQRVSSFVSAILGHRFDVENPSLLRTKAQMCAYLASDEREDLVPHTESCDSYHRKSVGQCGYCSSCLLRRQALAAAGLVDRTPYVVSSSNRPRRDPSVPLCAMLTQVDRLRIAVGRDVPSDAMRWEKLTASYPVLDDVADRLHDHIGCTRIEFAKELLYMYTRYVDEWDRVRESIAAGILDWQAPQASSENVLALD